MTRPFLDQTGAAEYLTAKGFKVSPKTLAKYRCIGGGPKFRKFGRVPIYDDLDLDAWVGERLSAPMRTTSDQAA